jgi:hypothetical protein
MRRSALLALFVSAGASLATSPPRFETTGTDRLSTTVGGFAPERRRFEIRVEHALLPPETHPRLSIALEDPARAEGALWVEHPLTEPLGPLGGDTSAPLGEPTLLEVEAAEPSRAWSVEIRLRASHISHTEDEEPEWTDVPLTFSIREVDPTPARLGRPPEADPPPPAESVPRIPAACASGTPGPPIESHGSVAIRSVTPRRAAPGEVVVVEGVGLGQDPEVWLGDVRVPLARPPRPDRLRVEVPVLGAGPLDLTVRTGSGAAVRPGALEPTLLAPTTRRPGLPDPLAAGAVVPGEDLWLGTAAGDLHAPTSDGWSRGPELHAPLRALASSSSGDLWAATAEGLYRVDARTRPPLRVTAGDFRRVSAHARGVWATGEAPAFVVQSPADGALEPYAAPFTAVAAAPERGERAAILALDDAGDLWRGAPGARGWSRQDALGGLDLLRDPRDCQRIFVARAQAGARLEPGRRAWILDGPPLQRLAAGRGRAWGASAHGLWTFVDGRWREVALLPGEDVVDLVVVEDAIHVLTPTAVMTVDP